jgi:hypothetical protein
MTTPPEVTPEMRRAVLDAECAAKGHRPMLDGAIQATGPIPGKVGGPEGQEPHIYCDRCGRVWLVVAEPGTDYADAEKRFDARLKAPPTRPARPGARP